MSKFDALPEDHALALSPIRVSGPDALDFLQAQLTLDLHQLAAGSLQATAWCNANGRVVIVILIAAIPDGFLLLVPQGMVEETLRRIRLFRIGRNVEVDARLVIEPCRPGSDASLRLAHSPQRAVRIRVAEPSHESSAGASGDTPINAPAELLDDIRHALPWIVSATSNRFLPQMLGLEALGGLSYRKGCYPGQEVIARVHFRGRVTRRSCRFQYRAPAALPPGLDFGETPNHATVLYSALAGPEHVIGLAVVAADSDATTWPRLDPARFEWLDSEPPAGHGEQ